MNRRRRGRTYSIPMSLIKAIVPENEDSVRLVLKGGEELELEDTADTGSGNAGVMIVAGSQKTYVRWSEVDRIDFSH